MTNKTPSGTEKYHESFEPESSKTTKMFFFLSFFLHSSSDGLARHYVNFSRMKQRHFIWSSVQPHRFCIISKSCKALVATHSKTAASTLGHHVLHLYMCMRTSGSPSNDLKFITQDQRIRNTFGVCVLAWAWNRITGVCVVLSIE